MYNQIDVLAVLEGKSEISKLFSVVRLVDVSNNYVCKIVDGKVVPSNRKCFCVWDRNRPCSNCITHRAFVEQKQLTKLQYLDKAVQLVLAVPVVYNNTNYVLELIKDITDSLVINDEYHPENTDIHDIIKELNTLAVMDPFTNLFNKKYIEKQIHEDIDEVKINNSKYILALFDIDNFKWVNDTYGHSTGDIVIQDVVQIIHKHIDKMNCWAARYGGDEFLLAFKHESMDKVVECCESIKNDINMKEYVVGDSHFVSSISIGIYQYKPESDTYESLLNNVDIAMYDNKKMK